MSREVLLAGSLFLFFKSEMASATMEDQYPGPRTLPEAVRLRAQHELIKDVFGGLVLCPVDLSQPGLRILDSATADGYFLYDLRSQLSYPESADFIGTDLSPFPDHLNLPSNVKLYKQDIRAEWPKEWEGTFDFVHQRAVMVNVPTFEQAVKVVKCLIKLLKPGGWIQLVDSSVPVANVEEDDLPSTKIFKTTGNFLHGIGFNPKAGEQISEMLEEAGGLKHSTSRNVIARLGKGASEELQKAAVVELEGLVDAMAGVLRGMPDPPMPADEFAKLSPLVVEEARTKGVEMPWFATWGQRV